MWLHLFELFENNALHLFENNALHLFENNALFSRTGVNNNWKTKEYFSGRISSTVDLLVLISLDLLLFILKILFTSCTKQATLMRRSMVQSLPLKLMFNGKTSAFRTKPGTSFQIEMYGQMLTSQYKNLAQGFSCQRGTEKDYLTG